MPGIDAGGHRAAVEDHGSSIDVLRGSGPESCPNAVAGAGGVEAYIEMGMTFDEYTAASQESGILMKADTLEELADMLSLP